jgi:hypothetical protein
MAVYGEPAGGPVGTVAGTYQRNPRLSGFAGYDCSLRSCPLGDDPLTVGGVAEVQTLTVSVAAPFALTFR